MTGFVLREAFYRPLTVLCPFRCDALHLQQVSKNLCVQLDILHDQDVEAREGNLLPGVLLLRRGLPMVCFFLISCLCKKVRGCSTPSPD